jgi:signal transduction histidine kinase
MIEALAEAPVAWPLALTCACAALAGGRVAKARRRRRLNQGLHELRRPLQALVLAASGADRPPPGQDGQLEQALDALAALDREVNGGAASRRRTVDARTLVEHAVARWRDQAALARRPLRLSWRANGSTVVCDPAAIGRALDNLIVNSLEHGRGTITVEAAVRARRLRLVVADGGETRIPARAPLQVGARRVLGRRRRDPRRGHGLRVVAEVAAAHGGRFASCRDAGGATAVLEIPLASR